METLPRLRHQLALGLIMVALMPIIGLQAVWSADEGALLYQADSLADGRGWTFDHPFQEADPSGTYFPIHLSSWADTASDGRIENNLAQESCAADEFGCRYIVLAKHAAFLWVAAGLYGIGGYPALILLSVIGGWAAAIATSRLASLIEPTAELPSLWVAGLASPLLMHSYIAWGHTVAAALIGWGAFWLLAPPDRNSGVLRHKTTIAALALLLLACLVRTEAPLAVIAIGLALLPRERRLGIVVLAVGFGGRVIDQLTDTATGGPVEPVPAGEAFGFLAGRIEAFTITWLLPAYGANPVDLLLLLSAACVLMAGVVSKRGQSAQPTVQLLLVTAGGALLARLVLGPEALVPGLVVAFPVLFGALLLLDRDMLTEDLLGELLGGFALFCGAVLATQYRYGGGSEWGGRYFAAGLPLGIAVGVVAAVRAGQRLDRLDRRRTASLLAVTMVVLSLMGLLGLRAVRQRTDQLATEIAAAVAELETTDQQTSDPGDPVVVSSIPGLGRWMWADIDDGRWLRIPQDDLATAAERLQSLGIDRLAFVSSKPDQELPLLTPWFAAVTETETDSNASVFILRTSDQRSTP